MLQFLAVIFFPFVILWGVGVATKRYHFPSGPQHNGSWSELFGGWWRDLRVYEVAEPKKSQFEHCCGCYRFEEPFRGCQCRCHPRNKNR
jgi:hypothetical protein